MRAFFFTAPVSLEGLTRPLVVISTYSQVGEMRLSLGKKQGCRAAVCVRLRVQKAGCGGETSSLGCVARELDQLKRQNTILC